MSRPDKVRVTTFVAVASDDAFDVFTSEIDGWWGKGPRFRFGYGVHKPPGVLRFEGGGAGGRLVEVFGDGTEYEVGKVLAWEPGARVAFEWKNPAFERGEKTEVEVTFAPKNGGTEVVVEHRGWAAIPDDHPVRHGAVDRAFTATLGMFWGVLGSSYRAFVGARKSEGG